jgi:hypothetical protein
MRWKEMFRRVEPITRDGSLVRHDGNRGSTPWSDRIHGSACKEVMLFYGKQLRTTDETDVTLLSVEVNCPERVQRRF